MTLANDSWVISFLMLGMRLRWTYSTMITPFSLAAIGSWLSITALWLLTEFVGIMISFWMETVSVSLFNVCFPGYYHPLWISHSILFVVSQCLPHTRHQINSPSYKPLHPDALCCSSLQVKSTVGHHQLQAPMKRKTWEKCKVQTSFSLPRWIR